MKTKSLLLSCLLLAVPALAADAADAGPALKTVTADELSAMMAKAQKPMLFDVRTEAEYQAEHIPGAASLPWANDAKAFAAKLPAKKSEAMVFYCNGPT